MTTEILTLQKNVTTSGTPVQVGSQLIDSEDTIVIKAKAANTGSICIGHDSASALNSGSAHFKLAAGEGVELYCRNLNQIWIDATVNGEGVEVLIG